MKEIWKAVTGYNGIYSVSNLGNVKRIGKGSDNRSIQPKELTKIPSGWQSKYLSVCLTYNNKSKKAYIHRLVCQSFLGDPPNDSYQVNHIDGDKHNNNLNNLEWVTPKENQQHRYTILKQTQKGENNPANKYSKNEISRVIELYKTKQYTQREIARITNIDYRYVNSIVNKKVWKEIEW